VNQTSEHSANISIILVELSDFYSSMLDVTRDSLAHGKVQFVLRKKQRSAEPCRPSPLKGLFS